MSSHGPHHRAFAVSHQRAILDLQLDGRFRALTEITIIPLSPDLTTVHLHSSACTILSTYHPNLPVNEPLEFILNEPDPVKIPDPSSVRQFPEAKRRLFERVNEKETGELVIKIDRSKIKRAARQAEPAESTPSALAGHSVPKEKELEFEPIVIGIEYQVTSTNLLVNHAICVVDGEFPHVFTNSISARSWIPCVDSIGDRCPWELEFIVPKLNPTGAQEPVMVIASGELLEQILHPIDPSKTVFHYCQAIPTSVQHIAWVLGPLKVHDLTPHRLSLSTAPQNNDQHDDDDLDQAQKPQDDSEEDSSNQINLHAFGLPNRTSQLLHTVQFLPHVLSFFTQEYGSYPYSSYKVVFVDMSSATHSLGSTFNSATLTLYPSDLLYPPEIIDQVYESKPAFVHALASQWVGINIIPKSPSDTWLINGLSLYITGLYFKSIWGTNEYRYRIKKDMLRCVEMDVNKPPICQPGLPLPIDTEVFGFINLKASLVLYILDRHLRRSGGGTSLGLSRVIPKIFLTAISGDMRDNMMSTNSFLRICRKSNGIELKSWADQWIYASGCPVFEVSAHFNRKKMTHELNLKQLNRSKLYYDDQHTTWEEKCNLKPLDRFEGQMTVRIHESDGVPYEHVLDIKEAFKRYELPSNHKNKRSKRPSRRYASTSQPNETEEAAARRAFSTQTGETEVVAADRFNYKPWEHSQEERDRWKVVDWTEDDDALISQSSVEWIRLDVEVEWICEFRFEMKEFMWLEQLQRDRDVVAQLEAVEALKRLPSKIVSSHLCRTVLTPEYFFRIRVEAVRALVSCATSQCGFLGLFHLLKLFQTYYCHMPKREPDNPFQIRAIPKPNQFHDLAEYFLRKALVAALGQVQDQNHNSPPVCQQFFIDQLIYNDNSLNQHSDAHYIATVISAMTDSFMHSADIAERGEVSELFGSRGTAKPADSGGPAAKRLVIMVNELDRCLMVDRLVPSYRNLLAIAVIEAKLRLMLADLLPVDLMFFLMFTRQGNYPPIRVLAFDCLLLLRGFHEKAIIRYMFVVMRDDQSLLVRRRLAMGFVQCLPILVMMEELGTESSKNSLSVIDATGESLTSKAKLDHKSVTKHLRMQVGRAIILRECVLSVMLHPTVDVDVQTCLLKISEVLFKPSDESVPVRLPEQKPPPPPPELATPTLPKIRIPATPVTIEPPPVQAPLPKIILKDSQHHPANDADNNTPSTPVPSAPQEVPSKLVASLIKKPKPAPKPKRFQASGMSIPDHKMCQNLLKKLASHPVGVPFRKAVDPIRQGAPDYFNIISRPMDFKTMSDKLEMGQYPNREAFRDDFNLVLDNCRTYNLADSPLVIKHAEPMKVIFDKLWERSEKTMNAIQAKGIGGSNVGWQKSTETKSLAAPTSTVLLAPPPSFAAFAAGGSMIPPPPPPTSPGPPLSMPSPRLSPEASRAVGLKVKLKPRSSLPSAMATPETPGPNSTMMPPPALKSALKIKLTANSASGSGYTSSMPTTKTSSEVSKALGHTRLTFPPPPPPTFPVPPPPVVSIAHPKSRPPPPPTFPAPPPPTLESFSFGSKPSSKSPPALPSASKHLPVVEPSSAMSLSTDRVDSQAHTFSDSSPPSQTPTVDPLRVITGPSRQPPRRPTIIAKLTKPPPHSGIGTPSGSTQTTSLPNFPAPPPPSIPQPSFSPPARPSSVAAGAPAPAPKLSGLPPPSNPMKIKVIQRSVPQPINQEPLPASPAASASHNPPASKPSKPNKSSKSSNKIAKAAVVAAANARASIERSRSNSMDPMAAAPTPPAPSTSPPLKKPKVKHEVMSSSFTQQQPPPLRQTQDQSMSRSTSSSSTFLSAPMSAGPSNAHTQLDYPSVVPAGTVQGGSIAVEDMLVPKKAKTIIRKMMDLTCAVWFRVPVDPIAVGAPTYLDEIKNPMDLSTMIKKVDRGVYKRLSELMNDFNLIVSNCIQFNGAMSHVALDAKEMERLWNLEWEKAAKMSYTDKRSLLGLFNKLNQVAGAEVFNVPVDPIGLLIPQYFEVIGGEENARDLGTIKANLVADRYNTIQEFEADVRQMFKNCFVFNERDTPVEVIGRDLEKVFDAGMAKIRKDAGLPPDPGVGGSNSSGGGNKRKGNEGGATSKRTKVG